MYGDAVFVLQSQLGLALHPFGAFTCVK